MKLQKFLSQAGVCSRRQAEKYIEQGKILVNGEVAHIGQVIDEEKDTIVLDDVVIQDQKQRVYYRFHKPRGIVTTCKSQNETGILDIIDTPERVFPIGRLDKDTTGLILLTNDGRLSHRLMHPSFEHEKEYVVEVFGKIEDSQIKKLSSGVNIGGYTTQPCEVQRIASGKFRIILKEGKNRQIRKMAKAVGLTVKKLKRVRVVNIEIGDLSPGDLEPLTQKSITTLLANLGITQTSSTSLEK